MTPPFPSRRDRLESLTHNQRRVLGTLQAETKWISAQDVFATLRTTSNIGLATVYRAIDTLKLAGLIQQQVGLNGESVYQTLDQDRHSLTCLQCGKSLPLDGCPVQKLEEELQNKYHFQVYYHTLEFFGLCEVCEKQ